MSHQLKKVALLFILTLFIAINSQIAFAQSFKDVSDQDWHYSYIEDLTKEGVFESSDNFRPNDSLNRAELVKILVMATGGLQNDQDHSESSSSTSTFQDVSADHWFYSYVETAVKMGMVDGYKDENGVQTGFFGPDDLVTRAAAAKTIIKAFAIDLNTDIELQFSDVDKNEWYYPYIATAFHHELVSGYNNGAFGPADPLTRAQIAKMTSIAKAKVKEVTEKKLNQETEAIIELEKDHLKATAGTHPMVALTDDQLPSTTVPLATSVPLLQFTINAGESDLHVDHITFTREGVGDASDWSGLFLYEGYFKVSSEHSISKENNQSTLLLNLTIKAGESSVMTLYGDTDVYATPLNRHYFSLASATDIDSNIEVSGDFPLMGNEYIIGTQYVNTVNISPGSTPARPRGAHTEVATFKLQPDQPNDVSLDAIILTKNGSVESEKITNCFLFRNTEQIGQSEGLYGDELIFFLEKPYEMKAGSTHNLSVKCAIDSTESQLTLQFYLDEIYDLIMTDLTYGFPAAPINEYSQSASPSLTVR